MFFVYECRVILHQLSQPSLDDMSHFFDVGCAQFLHRAFIRQIIFTLATQKKIEKWNATKNTKIEKYITLHHCLRK